MTDTDRHPITLATPRLLMRPPHAADAAAITALADNWNVVQHLRLLPYPYELCHAQAFIADVAARPAATDFAICLRAAPQVLIGIISITGPHDGDAERFGYWLGEPYWGSGHATEAANAVLEYGFERLGLDEVRSSCRPDNPASRNVLEKCGFIATGRGHMTSRALGREVAIDLFTLTLNAWRDRTGPAVPVTMAAADGCAGPESV